VNEQRYFITSQDVADTIRAQRAIRRWSQTALAERAGVGRRFIVDLEAGKPTVELGKTLKVLDALDIHAVALPPAPTPAAPGDFDLDAHLDRFRN